MSVNSVTSENFTKEVMESPIPVLVDFWADWCGPCKMMSPVVDEIASEIPDIKVVKVNIDNEPTITAQYGIMSIPTLVYIKDGKVIQTSVGVKSKQTIITMIKEYS